MSPSLDQQRVRRGVPQDLEAEAAVLGCCLLAPAALDEAATLLDPEDFYGAGHKVIYKALLDLTRRGAPPDLQLLRAELEARDLLKQVGGLLALSRLVDEVTTTANVAWYARLVREKALLRSLLKALQDGEAEIQSQGGGGSAEELVDQVERRVYEATRKRAEGRLAPVSTAIGEFHTRLRLLRERGDSQAGLASGFEDLDAKTRGFHPGELTLLAARPSMGKTSLALCFARSMMSAGTKVAFFSLETPRDQIASNLLAQEAQLNGLSLRGGFLTSSEEKRLLDASERLCEQERLWIDDGGEQTLMQIRSATRRLIAAEGIGAVFIDYLQLLNLDSVRGREWRGGERYAEVGEISRGLKQLAREVEIPVIALAQLGRKVDDRKDHRPMVSDLRESGNLEQDADLILLLYRPAYYDKEADKDEALLVVGKNRHGPTGDVALSWDPRFMRFDPVTHEGEQA